MPREDKLPFYEPLTTKINILSLPPAINGPTQDKSMPETTPSIESMNVLLPTWNELSHNKKYLICTEVQREQDIF